MLFDGSRHWKLLVLLGFFAEFSVFLVGCNSIGIAKNLLEMIAKYDLFHSNFLLVVIIYI